MKDKIIYFDNEKDNEFSGISKKTITIDENFKYVHNNIVWKFLSFIAYRIIMPPIAFLWCKIKFHSKMVNKKALKPFKKKGYFIYSNHTLMAADAFIPNLATFPQKNYMVVHPDNISTKGTKNFIMMCGAIPTPSSIKAFPNFSRTIKKRIEDGNAVTIYPEAHIWPYYTKIRKFDHISFSYPVKTNSPVFAFTTTYQKKMGRTPKITTYVDGPFFADDTKSVRENEKELCEKVYNIMVERSKNSTYEAIKYIKKEKNYDTDNICGK